MKSHTRRGRPLVGALLALTIALVVTACSTGTVGEGTDTPSASAPASGGDAAAALAAAYEGVVGAPPTEAVPVPSDMTAWIVSCGELATTCAAPAAGAVDASEQIGWAASVCDGELNPNGWGSCIRQGVAAQADVIVTIGQDCGAISGALQEAAAAGITTVNVGGVDCTPSLYTANVTMLEGFSYEEYWSKVGELQADWLIGQTDGAVKLLQIEFNDTQWGPIITDALEARLAECEECSIEGTVQLANSDLATGQLPQKFSTALLQYPDANAVAIPIDGWFLAGLGQAINASGRGETLNVIGNFGSIPNWEVIRSDGGQDATVASAAAWNGWAGIDAALRSLAGQDILPAGIGLQVVDAENNLPDAGAPFSYTPTIDFQADYLSVWER